jgi:tetratricopeptide (TPR) repeat protein
VILIAVIAAATVALWIAAGYRNVRLAQVALDERDYAAAAHLLESGAQLMPWRSELWERAGSAALQADELPDAVRLLQIAARRGALSARGWADLGSAMWSQGDRSAALSAWKSGASENPDDPPLLDRLAGADHALQEYAAEQTILEHRLRIQSTSDAHYRLGLVLVLTDKRRALQELTSAALLDREYEPAVTTLQAALRAAVNAVDESSGRVLAGRGLGLVEEWGLALQEFTLAAEADPNNAEALAWRGEARQHLDQDGRSDLDRALALAPDDSLVLLLRGLYWRRQGNSAQAVDEYRAAATLAPSDPALQALLGDAYAASGDLVSALGAYEDAARLAPNDAGSWKALARFCADNGVHVLDVGLPAAQKAAELAPQDPQILDALGWSYAQAGYLHKAEETLRKSLDELPTALTHLHLAQVYLRAGDQANAFDQLQKTVQLDGGGAAGNMANQLLLQYFPSGMAPSTASPP